MFVCAPRLYPGTPGWGVRCGCVCLGSGFGCHLPLLAGVLGSVCVYLCAPLVPATPGWGVRCGCVCLGPGFGCAPPLLAGMFGCVSVSVRAPLVPRHSWPGCAVWVCVLGPGFRLRPATSGWDVRVCVCLCVLRLYPATPGWAVRCGCVCLNSGFGCAPPLLAGVLGCVCVCVRAPLVRRHSWLGCLVWVCVLGLGSWLRSPTPGWCVGVSVCLCARSACTPPLLAGMCDRCVCLGSGLGCAPPLLSGVFGCVCVCVCARPACTPPLLAGLCGVGVCAWARVSAAPRHSWLGLCGVRVFVCALRLYLATPCRGVRCGCVRLGSGFGCAPPLLAWVLGSVCAFVRAPLVPRHSWLGFVVWVCVLGLGIRLRSATSG